LTTKAPPTNKNAITDLGLSPDGGLLPTPDKEVIFLNLANYIDKGQSGRTGEEQGEV
jgi:hypothetical protein